MEADELYQNVEEELGDEHSLADYWRIVMRNKWGIFALTLIGTLIGSLSAFTAVPIYKANATLLVEPAQPKLVNVQAIEGAAPLMLFYETQYEIIRSRAIAETVVDSLKLADRDIFLGLGGKFGRTGYRALLPDNIAEWFGEEERLTAEQRRALAIKKVQEHLTVQGGQKSQIVVINYESPHSKLAAEIVNGIAKAYTEYGMESRLSTVKDATSWLRGRLDDLRQQLEQSETHLEAFQTRESMVDTANRKQLVSTKMSSLASKLLAAQTKKIEAEIQLRQVSKALQQGQSYDVVVPLLESELVERLMDDLANLERKTSELLERYGSKHPRIIAAKADLEEARSRIVQEIRHVSTSIRKAYEAAIAKEEEAQRAMDQQQKEMRTLTGKGFQLVKLEREVETNRQLYDTFLARFKEVNTERDSDITNVRVIDTAQAPDMPYKPNKKRMVLVSLILGLFAGIALALLRNRLDNTFKRSQDIEERLLVPAMAEFPKLLRKKNEKRIAERYLLSEPRSAFAEAISHVRTGIMFSNLDNPIKTLMVTSPQPGEGKTTLSSNLAISFSHLGRTLLIDGDMRHPDIRRVTGLEKGPGFSEWLAGTNPVEACYRRDKECENLFIMTTGTIPPNPIELLSSKTFKVAFEKLKADFEYIIIDTPPVLPVSDALVLGNIVDGVILSLKFDTTTYPLAKETVKRLRANNIEPLGAVLSVVDMKKVKSYYGNRYYGNYYGNYYGKHYGENAKA